MKLAETVQVLERPIFFLLFKAAAARGDDDTFVVVHKTLQPVTSQITSIDAEFSIKLESLFYSDLCTNPSCTQSTPFPFRTFSSKIE